MGLDSDKPVCAFIHSTPHMLSALSQEHKKSEIMTCATCAINKYITATSAPLPPVRHARPRRRVRRAGRSDGRGWGGVEGPSAGIIGKGLRRGRFHETDDRVEVIHLGYL
eukprot:Selendium_serpulae@DN3197_c0_g1_i2.p1